MYWLVADMKIEPEFNPHRRTITAFTIRAEAIAPWLDSIGKEVWSNEQTKTAQLKSSGLSRENLSKKNMFLRLIWWTVEMDGWMGSIRTPQFSTLLCSR
jgi:hypothetical protein